MHHLLVWTKRKGWLSQDKYPEIHRHFEVGDFSPTSPLPDGGALLVVDEDLLREYPEELRHAAQESSSLTLPVVAVSERGDGDCPEIDELVFDVLPGSPRESDLLRTLRNAGHLLESQRSLLESQMAAEQKARELEELNAIGIALSAERDHERLLNLILSKSREITCADAGSLFLVESIDMPIGAENRTGDQQRVRGRWLRFRLAQNDSRDFKFEEDVLAISRESIAGYVAETGVTLNLEDAYDIPPDKPFSINRSFDETTGYRTRSMLVVPMLNPVGATIGVLQLINKKRNWSARLERPESFETELVPFTALDEQLVRSLASQAAVSVDNNRLYQRIEKLFNDFVQASVRAIESRDPTTRGHSRRVADMTTELARVVNRTTTGPYRELNLGDKEIRELKYAALLHDFGKVGVNEKVLVKATKLYYGQLDVIRERFQTIKRTVEVQLLRTVLKRLADARTPVSGDELASMEDELRRTLAELDEALGEILARNEPTVTHVEGFEKIQQIGGLRFPDLQGAPRPYLEPRELDALLIPRGTLTREERAAIQGHVQHTFNFLYEIEWTRDLQKIPKIARSHHEKLDGSGYRYGLSGDEIPPQTRMMTIADIFDALAARDRPYKKAVPPDKALDILVQDAKAGQVDTDLLDLFIEAKVFELALK
ncbi:MAG TPA: HD domain-containing phosphohydrolase [Vicinamibacteria bacterium]|jgi:HD-GYP domain-containing protein (c-di-GMP phosphodiesterase class II)